MPAVHALLIPLVLVLTTVHDSGRNRLTAVLLVLAGMLIYLSYGFAEMAGSDLWWHIAAGRELVQTQSLWMVDDWSYSALGRDWLNHEWLSDLVFYGWVSLWGVKSLVYWKLLVLVVTFALLQQVLRRASGSAAAALICAATAMAIAEPFLDVRPHIYSLLSYSLLLLLVLNRKTSVWPLALLFVVWVNLHGGFFFGLMALGILLFPWRNFSRDSLRSAVTVGLVCLLAAMLNPSGIDTFFYPLKYAFDQSSPFKQLAEWHSPFRSGGIRSPLFFVFMWAPLAALAYALPWVRKRVSIPWEGFILTALTLAMALTSRRFIPLFAISLAVLLAPLLGLFFRSLPGRVWPGAVGIAALFFGIYRLLPYQPSAAPAYHYLTAEYMYPVDTVEFMEANKLHGNVFAFYNWGGYIHWRTDGGIKVYMDGRADTIYDAGHYNTYLQIAASAPGWIEELEATGAEFMLWPQIRQAGQEKLAQLVQTGRWVPVYRDSVSWLAVRKGRPLPDPLIAPAASPWGDLGHAQISLWSGDYDVAVEYAEKVRVDMPWHKGACNVLTDAYRRQGKPARAEEVLLSCRSYFPSPLLR